MNINKITVNNTYSILKPTKDYATKFLKKIVEKPALERLPEYDSFVSKAVSEGVQKENKSLIVNHICK